MSIQTHLNKNATINLGSFYTPKFIVQKAYELLEKINLKDYLLFDSSCGYGDFFLYDDLNYLGADIDGVALSKVSKNIKVIHTNSLDRKSVV